MNEQALINKIAALPFQNFSAEVFAIQIRDTAIKFQSLGESLIGDIAKIDLTFNEKRIQKIISSSSNSQELVQKLTPYLENFNIFSVELFGKLQIFFQNVEENEAVLSGFKYRFLADSISIFQAVNKCELYLLDENNKDIKEVGKFIKKFSKGISNKTLEQRTELIAVTKEEVEEYIRRSKARSIKSLFLKRAFKTSRLNGYYFKFLKDCKSAAQFDKKRQIYNLFDTTRSSLVQDINNKKIKLDFIKKLQEYFGSLEQIEFIIYDMESGLLKVMRELNADIINLNQKIFQFINYVLNEEKIGDEIKENVKAYLTRVESLENNIKAFSAIINSQNDNLENLDKMLVAQFEEFIKLIEEHKKRNQSNSQEILEKRLAA